MISLICCQSIVFDSQSQIFLDSPTIIVAIGQIFLCNRISLFSCLLIVFDSLGLASFHSHPTVIAIPEAIQAVRVTLFSTLYIIIESLVQIFFHSFSQKIAQSNSILCDSIPLIVYFGGFRLLVHLESLSLIFLLETDTIKVAETQQKLDQLLIFFV